MSPMTPGAMPKPSGDAKAAFQSLVPNDPSVTTRPMFGNLAAFVNGNMFAGLFGEELFVRLPDAEQTELLTHGGRAFEPMPGRAMKGYVVVPEGWRDQPAATGEWVARSLLWARGLPAKHPKAKAAKK
jgi:TfoX/Sxy family transcriptional regulator of competence genes